MEAQAGHDAELFRGESQKGLKPDFNECKDGTENGYNGHGKYGLVRFCPDCAGNTHDCGCTADAAATGGKQSQCVIDPEQAGCAVVQQDHSGDDQGSGCETFEPGSHEQDKIELEAEQDDSCPEKAIGDERRAFLRSQRKRTDDLKHHAEQQCDDQRANQRKARKRRELPAGNRAAEREHKSGAESAGVTQIVV